MKINHVIFTLEGHYKSGTECMSLLAVDLVSDPNI